MHDFEPLIKMEERNIFDAIVREYNNLPFAVIAHACIFMDKNKLHGQLNRIHIRTPGFNGKQICELCVRNNKTADRRPSKVNLYSFDFSRSNSVSVTIEAFLPDTYVYDEDKMLRNIAKYCHDNNIVYERVLMRKM